MLVRPHDKATFDAWWDRLQTAGFLCLQSRSRDEVWEYVRDRIAPRFAEDESGLPNMEVQFATSTLGRRALDDAWELDLLGTPGRIGDLSDQIAYKLYLGSEKDLEDAEHIATVAREVLDWGRIFATALSLEVPMDDVERLRLHAKEHL